MDHYSDAYYRVNKDDIEKAVLLIDCRKRLVEELSPENMLRILFQYCVCELSNDAVIRLAEEYVDSV